MRSTWRDFSRSAARGCTSRPRPVYSLTVELAASFALILAQSKPGSGASPKVEACLCSRRPRRQIRPIRGRLFSMGILIRDGRYILRWTDGTGRRRFRVSKAETKTEAKRLLRELERQAERQRLGIDPLPSDTTLTLGEVCQWWLDHRCPKASVETERLRLGRHVLTRAIGRLSLPRVTSERVEALLVDLEKAGASPASVNKLRSVLHTVFSRARKAQLWVGNNPIADVATRRVAKRAYVTLRADEVPTVLSHVDEEWRNLFAAALYTGLRKGELCGLLKTDVDLPNRTLTVTRSYDRHTTKGGHADAIPIAEALVPYLEDAIAPKRVRM